MREMTGASGKVLRMQKRNEAREVVKQERKNTVKESICRKADRNILNLNSRYTSLC